MKKIAMLLMALATTTTLAACNSNTNTANDTKKEAAPLKAALTVPETAKVGDKIELKVDVIQNGKAVTNAKDVAFEVKNNDTNSDKMVTAKLQDDAYVASYDVKDAGKYEVTAHVAAKDGGHVMPNADMTVSKDATTSEHATHDNHKSTTGSATAEQDHHHGDVAVMYNHKHTVAKDKAINLSVSLKHDGKALSNASVHYQVLPQFKGGKPTWITLKETSDGTYEGKHTFTQAGAYQLKLHVENDEGLHAHEVKVFTVK
ncbi:FixH family protein [Rummeliibacillus pycnus]|uniref:FixH family protein n=1 Tax=Rummeliibacillus pycnus TaxID=101070 RepID=UPI0037CAD0FE